MTDVRDLLDSDRVVLFDGAMGTQIYARGVFLNRCYDLLSLERPELIREIHRSYREAGAMVLETNSFGASRIRLRNYGLEDRTGEINEAAASLAADVAGEECFVAGSLGPLGVRIEPYGPTSENEAREAYLEQARALARGGADLFVLETFSDLNEIRQAVAACVEVGLPVVAQMTIQLDGSTSYGLQPDRIAAELEGAGADAVGLNCSVGPAALLEAVPAMAAVTDLPLSAVPNAGLPKEVEGRKMYMASPEYMASYARRLVEAGARIVGGCCGTGPEHVREMARRLEADPPRPVRSRTPTREPPEPAGGKTPVPLAERSRWGRKIARGEPVTSVEILPPPGPDAGEMLRLCRDVEAAGVDAVNIPDGPRASLRMSSVAAAALVERELELEAVVHYACRDRNLLGMLGDLLGAGALGLRNLLMVTGDPPKTGPYAEATAVFDVDAIGLTNLVRHLNRGLDLGGNDLGSQTSFVLGVAVNPGAEDMEHELRRWYWKVDAGAEYAVTQPVFHARQLLDFLEAAEAQGTRIPVVAGVWPLSGLRDAEFLNHEVPGVRVPETVMKRMARAEEEGEEQARREGLRVARETVEALRGEVAGIQVSAPRGDVEAALRVLEALPDSPATPPPRPSRSSAEGRGTNGSGDADPDPGARDGT